MWTHELFKDEESSMRIQIVDAQSGENYTFHRVTVSLYALRQAAADGGEITLKDETGNASLLIKGLKLFTPPTFVDYLRSGW